MLTSCHWLTNTEKAGMPSRGTGDPFQTRYTATHRFTQPSIINTLSFQPSIKQIPQTQSTIICTVAEVPEQCPYSQGDSNGIKLKVTNKASTLDSFSVIIDYSLKQ